MAKMILVQMAADMGRRKRVRPPMKPGAEWIETEI
jgi:hypothetical protein